MICGRYGDVYEGYNAYIQSDEWREFANDIKADRGYECERCGATAPHVTLDVDHIDESYPTLGRETEDDVQVLCRRCHKEKHGIIEVSTPGFGSFSMSMMRREDRQEGIIP